MANILYGVNGEGSGHSSRAREVIAHLEEVGHRVHVASFDRGYRNLNDDFDVTEIDGLRLAYVENRVRYRKTVLRNLLHLPKTARTVRDLGKKAADWHPCAESACINVVNCTGTDFCRFSQAPSPAAVA